MNGETFYTCDACSPGEAAPPPNTPAQHYLAEHNGCASQDWQDGFNACARAKPAAEQGWGPSYKQPWQAKEDATQPEYFPDVGLNELLGGNTKER